jgi:hypothetical protein
MRRRVRGSRVWFPREGFSTHAREPRFRGAGTARCTPSNLQGGSAAHPLPRACSLRTHSGHAVQPAAAPVPLDVFVSVACARSAYASYVPPIFSL